MKSTSLIALFAALPFGFSGLSAQAATTALNTGSLGTVANGTNADGVVVAAPGAVVAAGTTDRSANYSGGSTATPVNTVIPFTTGLNPGSATAFSIEFWARPTSSDNDDAVISNRVGTGNRSGWIFFQRDAASGWNFRMYNGDNSSLGWDLTGGTATLNAWSHVVVTWSGSGPGAMALLYVNGVLADNTNAGGLNGVYNPNTSVISPSLSIGANADGGSPYNGAVDEVAFYGSALTALQISEHYQIGLTNIPAFYQNTVLADGALLQITNNPVPEPGSMLMLGLGGLGLLARRRRA